jgi:transposase-like protein
MDAAEFAGWLSAIAALTPQQRREAWQTLALSEASEGDDIKTVPPRGVDSASSGPEAMPDQPPPATPSPVAQPLNRLGSDVVAELGQRRVDSIGCPHCDSRDVVHWGKASALPRYRCKSCQRTFNALTKTPLAGLRMKDKWPAQAEAMIEGVSLAKAAKRCDVDYTTAFRWRHRFLASLAGDKPGVLSGIVEGDEPFILESFKGRRSGMPRKARKRGGRSAKRGMSAEQIPVLVARDRQGATTDAVLPKLNRVSITAALGGIVTAANEFCCDGGTAIVAFAGLASQPTSCQCPASPTRQHPISTSTTSMPTIAASRNGCVPSMASRRRTCPITSAGAALWRRWAKRSCLRILSSEPSDLGHINNQRYKSLDKTPIPAPA